jgi:5-methylcytosine-specific restriction endonuclease McrA
MQRNPNTDCSGKPFRQEIIEAVWQKGRTMGIYATLRVDAWGWTIARQDYGNVRSRYGWEIDHIIPVAQGGDDDLSNLQPLQWENNRRKEEVQSMTASPARVAGTPPRARPGASQHKQTGRGTD